MPSPHVLLDPHHFPACFIPITAVLRAPVKSLHRMIHKHLEERIPFHFLKRSNLPL